MKLILGNSDGKLSKIIYTLFSQVGGIVEYKDDLVWEESWLKRHTASVSSVFQSNFAKL